MWTVDGTAAIATRRGPAGALGGVGFVGRIEGGRGVPGRTARRYGAFGLVYVFAGAGRYRDANHDLPVAAGSVISVVPGHPHWYGVTDTGNWDEVYLTFSGPVFDAAQRTGLIGTETPVRRLLPVAYWLDRFDRFRLRRPPRTAAARDREAVDVLRLLTDVHAAVIRSTHDQAGRDWFARSQQALETDLGEQLSLEQVAADVGLPYETWRRRFRDRAGSPPARYRRLRRIEAAGTLLTDTSLSVREIALSLGFTDEHHLNRHFRATMGMTPRAYRDAAG